MVIFGPLIIIIARSLSLSPIPFLLAAALLSDTGGVATLVGDPPNLMIGSAKGIDFNTFFVHMGGVVFLAWLATILVLRVLFRRQLAAPPQGEYEGAAEFADRKLWNQSLVVLGVMVLLFMVHHEIA